MKSPQREDAQNKRAFHLITKRIENETKYRNSLAWATINFGLFAVLTYDIYYSCPYYSSSLHFLEVLLATVFFVCSLYNLCHYLWLNIFTSPIELTAPQFQLFNICREDPNFKLKYSSTPAVSPDVTPLNLSSTSWLSSSFVSPYGNDESNLSTASRSQFDKSQSIVYDELDPIDNEASYRDYSFESNNRSLTIDYSFGRHTSPGLDKSDTLGGIGGTSGLFRTFWSYPDSKAYANVMKTPAYHSSPVSPNKTKLDSDSKSRLYLEEEVWKQLKMNPYNLTKWTNNLKLWLYRTILTHIKKEIDAVNASLVAHSMPDVQVGCVGLDRLRALIGAGTLGNAVPSLSLLVRFLSVSSNQEYVVQRIKELSRNWYLSDYKWNAGGTGWASHLPSDSRLLHHLLITYLDSLAPALGGGASFSSSHVTSGPAGTKGGGILSGLSSLFGGEGEGGGANATRGGVSIHEASVSPPHYQLHVAPDHVYEIPKGRNNMFETVLAFLHYVKTKEQGLLGRLNFGPTGANMLWIVEDTGSSHASSK